MNWPRNAALAFLLSAHGTDFARGTWVENGTPINADTPPEAGVGARGPGKGRHRPPGSRRGMPPRSAGLCGALRLCFPAGAQPRSRVAVGGGMLALGSIP